MIFYELYDVCLFGREFGGREQEMMNGPMVFLKEMKKKKLLACLFVAMTVGYPVWAAGSIDDSTILHNLAKNGDPKNPSIAIGSVTGEANATIIGKEIKSGNSAGTAGNIIIGNGSSDYPQIWKEEEDNNGTQITRGKKLVDYEYPSSGNVVIGYQSRGQGYAVSIGFTSNSEKDGVALGGIASAQGNGVAIGRGANAGTGLTHSKQLFDEDGDPVKKDGLPVFEKHTDTTLDDTAIGAYSKAYGGQSSALGCNSAATGEYSTALGYSANAANYSSTAVGSNSEASGWASTSMGYGSKASGTGAIALGYAVKAEAEGSIAIGFDNRYGGPARSSADHSIALGGGANASLKNSAAIGTGSATSYDFTKAQTSMTLDGNTYNFAGNPTEGNGIISVGNSNTQLQRVITNVAPGRISSDSTDAINGSQLYGTNQALEALDHQVALNVDSIVSLQSDVHSLGHRVNKVGAGAAALAGLHPLDFDPDDKWDFAASVGSYRNAHAMALGAFYRPNEGTLFSLGGSFGNGENMWNAGVSLKLGRGSGDTSYSKTVMAREIVFLQDRVRAQDEKISSYETRLAAQDKELAELKDTVRRLSAAVGVK